MSDFGFAGAEWLDDVVQEMFEDGDFDDLVPDGDVTGFLADYVDEDDLFLDMD